jgi:hypothetical protein
MAPSGMLRRVALVRTDVSEELSASFIRVKRIGELGTTLTVTNNRAARRRNIPEDAILQEDCWHLKISSHYFTQRSALMTITREFTNS